MALPRVLIANAAAPLRLTETGGAQPSWTVRVSSPAKTVVDCFRYRNKIALDVAIEALRDCYQQRLTTLDELWEYASKLRTAAVMRPYLESPE